MNDFTVSFMTLEDLDSIAPILSTEFDDFWSYMTLKSELEKDDSFVLVAKQDSKIVGFADIWKAIDVMHLMDIVVAKDYREKHIGSLLMNEIIKLCIAKDIYELTLEVKENNTPAINLYKKFGFKDIGIRKNYYGANNNAVIMTLYIDKNFKEELLSEKN